jgi:spore germination protein
MKLLGDIAYINLVLHRLSFLVEMQIYQQRMDSMRNHKKTKYAILSAVFFASIASLPSVQAKVKRMHHLRSSTTTSKTSASSSTSSTTTNPPKTVLGYYTVYYAGDSSSYNSLSNFESNLNAISTATFDVTSTGAIAGAAPSNGITSAKSKGIAAYANISNVANGKFDSNLAHTILSNSTLRQTVVNNIVNLVKTNGYTGADVDFENIPPTDRTSFTSFITQLVTAMHAKGYKVIVSMEAKASDSPTNSWSGAFDYAALGKVADQLQLMTYDEHGPWGTPGPVASYSWVHNVVNYAVSTIPSTKILIGLAAYGYDWNTTTHVGNKAVAWKNIPALISSTGATPQWDSTSQSPFFTYHAPDGTSHIVWYENSTSIEAKTKLVKQYNLGGVSMWRMGLEDGTFWSAVHAGLTG